MKTENRKRFIAPPAAALAILAAAQLACAVDVNLKITPPPVKISTVGASAITPKVEATPTAAATEGSPGGGGGTDFACFGTLVNGVTCLTANGWITYTEENSDLLDDSPVDMAARPGGTINRGDPVDRAEC